MKCKYKYFFGCVWVGWLAVGGKNSPQHPGLAKGALGPRPDFLEQIIVFVSVCISLLSFAVFKSWGILRYHYQKCLSFYSQIPQIKLIPMSFLYFLFVLGKCISFLNRVQCAMWFFSSEAIILLILYFSHFFCKSGWTPKMQINNEMFKLLFCEICPNV